MNDTTTDAASLFAPLWKRKWLILLVGILVAAGTYEYYKRQPALFTAKTALFLGGAAEGSSAGGGSEKRSLTGRALADQVELINSPVIGEPVRKRLHAEGNIPAAKAKMKATASAAADFITIATESHRPRAAVALANAYAQAYVKRERAAYLRGIESQISNTRQQLRRIEAPIKGKGGKGSSSSTSTIQAATLASKINQLEASLSNPPGVQQIGTAKASPLPISPKPKTNAIFGFVLGLLLASVAAYVLARMDRRLRTLGDVERVLGGQVLAALPTVKHPIKRPDGSRAPAKSHLEPLRRLHTTLQLGDMLEHRREGGPRAIVFLSADPGDGKSTVVANLARVQRDAGARVAVIEADFRRPVLARLLDVSPDHGLADVLTGRLPFSAALKNVDAPAPVPAPDRGSRGGGAGVAAPALVEAARGGSLAVLPSGGVAANPPALLGGAAMADLVRSAAEEYDYVLIDAPSPLEVSDVMPLLPLVDGMIIVARLGHTRDTSARRLAELLGRVASSPQLGIVANCVPRRDMERYGFSSTQPTQRGRSKLSGR